MDDFLKRFSKIKMTNIAKEHKLDYSNIIQKRAKKEDINFLEKEVKKKTLSILLYENLNQDELNALSELKSFIENRNQTDIYYTCDQKDINNIYILYKIFEVV